MKERIMNEIQKQNERLNFCSKITQFVIKFSILIGVFGSLVSLLDKQWTNIVFSMTKPSITFIFIGLSLHLAKKNNQNEKKLRYLCSFFVIILGIISFYDFQQLNFTHFFYGPSFDFSILFILAGLSLLLIDSTCYNFKCLDQLFSVITIVFSLISISNHLYQPYKNVENGFLIGISITSAITTLLVSIGILCLRTKRGLMILVVGNTLGGDMVRKILAVLFCSVPLWAMITNIGKHYAIYDNSFRLYLNILLNLLTFVGLIWFIAGELAKIDIERNIIAQQKEQLLLETQNQATMRKEIVAIVSHDLKNPLSAMLMNSDILQRITLDLTNGLNKEAQLKKVEHNIRFITQRMFHLVGNLLDFNRLQNNGGYLIEKKAHSVAEIIDGVRDMFSDITAQRKISLLIEEKNREEVVFCDFEQVLQVFSNLIGNAMKYTAQSGHIRLLVEKLDNQSTLFSVEDSGSGIPKQQLNKIFELYFQGNQKIRQTGLGLGLAICKGIILAHGGKIWAESVLGEGTKVSFSIPNEMA
jgi:signal transduction histidine kinase